MQDNPLWHYSLALYSRPGVEPLLINLQDAHNADVNLLLCCGWLGEQGQTLSLGSLQPLVDVSASWREQCVGPLREVRRFLKGSSEDEAFREQVKALEIEAEQRQQALIYQQWQLLDLPCVDSSLAAINDNLSLYGSLLSPVDPGKLSQGLVDLAELMKG